MGTDTVEQAFTRLGVVGNSCQSISDLVEWRDNVVLCTDRTQPNGAKHVVFFELSRSPSALLRSVEIVASNEIIHNPLYLELKTRVRDRYTMDYPDYPVGTIECHDASSCFFYLKNSQGDVVSVMRVILDSPAGLCMESSFAGEAALLRSMDLSIAEPSRFVNIGSRAVFKQQIRAIYQLACWLKLDYFILQNRREHSAFYARNFGAIKVRSNQAALGCDNMLWHIPDTPSQFKKTFGADQGGLLHSLKQLGYA